MQFIANSSESNKRCLECDTAIIKGKFCSNKCCVIYIGKQKTIRAYEEYQKNPLRCHNCQIIIPFEKRHEYPKYCSHSCRAQITNLGVRRRGNPPANCHHCGKRLNSSKGKFCSFKCKNEKRAFDYIQKWLSGQVSGMKGQGLSNTIRKYLFEQNKNKCQNCGWSKINKSTGKIPLTIHHKDGNWRNNFPTNLELLCPNCHSLTPFFGSKNKGRGRDKRRKIGAA
jgi:hypothetical protein